MNQWTKHPVSLLERFNQKWQPVTESGCWIWTGESRYGKIRSNGKMRQANVVSHELFIGPVPSGMEVCHRCDVACCVNPSHLFLGTHKDNCDDRDRKGRNVNHVGEAHAMSRLTDQQVTLIRSIDYSDKEWAEEFGVTAATIRSARTGHTWAHVAAPPIGRRTNGEIICSCQLKRI